MLAALVLACAAPDARSPDEAAARASPVPLPRLGIRDCVESEDLKSFVLALDAHRTSERDAALSALGGVWIHRRGQYADAPEPQRPAPPREIDGQRLVVVAHQATHFEPEVTLARVGNRLHRVDDRGNARAIAIRACGVDSCSRGRGARGARAEVKPLRIALEPTETWGDPIVLRYDYWWAQVRHVHHRDCPSPPP